MRQSREEKGEYGRRRGNFEVLVGERRAAFEGPERDPRLPGEKEERGRRTGRRMTIPHYMLHTASSASKAREVCSTRRREGRKPPIQSRPNVGTRRQRREGIQPQRKVSAALASMDVNSDLGNGQKNITRTLTQRKEEPVRVAFCEVDQANWDAMMVDLIRHIVQLSPDIAGPLRLVNKHWCTSVDSVYWRMFGSNFVVLPQRKMHYATRCSQSFRIRFNHIQCAPGMQHV